MSRKTEPEISRLYRRAWTNTTSAKKVEDAFSRSVVIRSRNGKTEKPLSARTEIIYAEAPPPPKQKKQPPRLVGARRSRTVLRPKHESARLVPLTEEEKYAAVERKSGQRKPKHINTTTGKKRKKKKKKASLVLPKSSAWFHFISGGLPSLGKSK